MKKLFAVFLLVLGSYFCFGQATQKTSGNPVFPGWYADPEGIVFGKNYWIYPTYSALYNQQVFMDAFSSPDLVNWTKHSRIIDTTSIRWAKLAMWAPSIIEKGGKYYFFFGANDIQSDQELGGIGVAVVGRRLDWPQLLGGLRRS